LKDNSLKSNIFNIN